MGIRILKEEDLGGIRQKDVGTLNIDKEDRQLREARGYAALCASVRGDEGWNQKVRQLISISSFHW